MQQVDQVRIDESGGPKTIPLESWVGMSLGERVDLIRSAKVQFMAGESDVPVKDALAWIKQQRGA